MDPQLEKALEEHIVLIKFRKVDGEIREMRCTLNASMLPPKPILETIKTRKPNMSVYSVFDLDKAAWRSFKKDNVIDWKIND